MNSKTDTLTAIPAFGPMSEDQRHKKKSQVMLLKEWLESGKKIHLEIARMQLGIGHLPRRIKDCKDFLGMNIKDRMIKYKRSFDGEFTEIKEYWLEPKDPGEQTRMKL